MSFKTLQMLGVLAVLALPAAIVPALAADAEGTREVDSGTVIAGINDVVAGIRDIPLMPGLTEVIDETVIYDKPQGRIIFATTIGAESRYQDVRQYYQSELLERGWQERRARSGDIAFQRTGEVLEINIEPLDGVQPASPLSDTVGVRASFRLSPL